MKGDFSRQTFEPTKHYSGVLMQQGRVQTDADWNEQEAILRRRIHVEARDVIGRCGAPEDDAGFEITIQGAELRIGAGRCYVDGLLAENEDDGLAFGDQPDLPGANDWTQTLDGAQLGLVYLDVWERHITALDDPLLREVALGGPDTATRIKTVWQVRVLPLLLEGESGRRKKLEAKRASLANKLAEAIARGVTGGKLAELEAAVAALDAAIAALGLPPGCATAFPEWDALVADPPRRINARTKPPEPESGPCTVPPTAGYRRLENQLYRVEVHEAGARGKATFKWSRDNGSVVTAIRSIRNREITVADLGPDEALGFASGQWVEITDDRLELDGAPGELRQIVGTDESLRRITLDAAPTPLSGGADGIDPGRHPKLRRWDQTGNGAGIHGVLTSSEWVLLEDGVEVQFSSGEFRTGDQWVIPARTATGEIEWPPFEIPNVNPQAQLRRGIHHHFCRLAFLAREEDGDAWTVVEDCRNLFPPLTESCCDAKALHVVESNWTNDDALSSQKLLKEGLRIRLDGAPDPRSLTNETVQVEMEVSYDGDAVPTRGIQRVYLPGEVGPLPGSPSVIVWRLARVDPRRVAAPPTAGRRKVAARRLGLAAELPAFFTAADPRRVARLWVTLKGSWIWSKARGNERTRLLLDGRASGEPAFRADGSPRIGLVFPSGSSTVSSDFESWLDIVAKAEEPTLQVTNVRFLDADEQASRQGDLTPPFGADIKVVYLNNALRHVDITFNRKVRDNFVTAPGPPIYILKNDDNVTRPLKTELRLQPGGLGVRVTITEDRSLLGTVLTLVCVGTKRSDHAPVVAEDGLALDGDYSGEPGGDLLIGFQLPQPIG